MTDENRAKLLLVDDKPENLLVLEKLLKNLPVEIYKATSGNQALSLTLENDFILILMDVQMPGMDGYEVKDVLSWDDRTKHIPVIFVTANYADEIHQLKGYQYGAVDYLFKPINEQILLSKVKVFLELYEQRLRLQQLQQRYQLILDTAGEGVIELDEKGIIRFCNPTAAKALKYTTKELIGKNFIIIFNNSETENVLNEMPIYQECKQGKKSHNEDTIFFNKAKAQVPVSYTATPLYNEQQNFSGIVVVFSDITLRKTTEEQLTQLALYDHLTGLPNRFLFERSINQALSKAARHRRSMAVMFLDLDHFKNINDTLGHDYGDLLLQKVGKRVQACLRLSDTVARLGGDEFAIILDEIESPRDARITAEKIIESLKPPFTLNSHEVFTSTSIGIAIYPITGENSASLIKNADIAMYKAKHQGRNSYCFYSSNMSEKNLFRLNLSQNLRYALERNEFFLCYQPRLNIETNKITEIETLLRWNHPQHGVVLPHEFVPLAEEAGLMLEIGNWVLATACQEAQPWLNQYSEIKRLSVKLATSQLINIDIPALIQTILEKVEFDPHKLEIELHETLITTHIKRIEKTLQKLHALGISTIIDNFCTGYLSLSILKTLPIDALKIDRTFVHNIPANPNDTAIVKASIALAHSLNLKIIAAGVETEETIAFLKEQGCDQIQGFLFSKPLIASEMSEFLRENLR
jgi:diguanylate cyclase (GGDEF)-like protein/PAS domain S-box-containing protein